MTTERRNNRQFVPAGFMLSSVLALLTAVLVLALGAVRTEAAPKRIILVGDSRTVMMKEYCGGATNVIWSCKTSMGYNWMVSTGVPAIEGKITNSTAVAILLGVNDSDDTWMADNYAAYINRKAKAWKKLGAQTYFFSIPPVNDKLSKMEHNVTIKAFNKRIKPQLSSDVTYVDIYSSMAGRITTTSDGVHYSATTSRLYYNLVMQAINSGGYTAEQLKKNPDIVVSEYFKPVYNFKDYLKYNPSLKTKYASDPEGAYKHFLNVGMAKGLRGSDEFDPVSYRLRYKRIRKYGDNWKKYYHRYITFGKKHGANGRTCTQMKDYETVYEGVDYKLVYNYNEYIKLHASVFKAYGYNDDKVLKHFVKYGMKAGWSGNYSFKVKIYQKYNADLAKLFGNNYVKYFDHYMRKGYKQTWRRHK